MLSNLHKRQLQLQTHTINNADPSRRKNRLDTVVLREV
jgi:hypothetical protein